MIPPTSIDGTDITGATIDGTDVQEITVDGDVVFTALPPEFDALDLRYKLDEGSGTNITDSIGSEDGFIINSSWVSDLDYTGGQAIDLQSGGGWISNNAIPCNEPNLTAMAWWNWDGVDNDPFWHVMQVSPNDNWTEPSAGWRIAADTDKNPAEYVLIFDGVGIPARIQTPTNTGWHFHAVSFTSTGGTYYVFDENGLYESENVNQRAGVGNLFHFGGGRNSSASRFPEGEFDDIMLSTDTALTQAEITTIYNETYRPRFV